MAQQPDSTIDAQSVPGPTKTDLFGQVVRLLRTDTAPMLQDLRQRYGPIVRLQLPTEDTPTYLLADPAYVQQVLEANQDNYRKAEIYQDELGEVFGQGLLISEGDLWRRQHRRIRPMFTADSVRSFTDLVVEETDAMCDRWQATAARDDSISLLSEMERVTLRIIGRAMFSADMDDHAVEIAESLDVLRTEFQRQTNRVRPTLPSWLPTPHNRRVAAARDRLDDIVFGLIEDRRGHADEYDDLLAALMTAGEETDEGMDDEQIRDELMTFLLAGHETTAAALTWTWYSLARNPEIHETLHTRVEERTTNGRDLASFGGDDPSYAKQCIQEAMRLYPPVPVFVREAETADTFDGYEVPAGSEVLLSQYVVHRDPDLWDAPTEYRPERFAPDAADRPAYCYFPFGGGPRMCIGRQFALLEAQLVLSHAVGRYRLELQSPSVDPGVDSAVTMVPDQPLEMQLEAW